jgi:hypothetical protein
MAGPRANWICPTIPDDELITADRLALRTLYLQRGIVPAREGFGCPHLSCCSVAAKLKLITGTWAYVGTAYGQARVDGRAVKILFVAMDTGGKDELPDPTLAAAHWAAAQCDFRCGAEKPRNPHMRGVHLILNGLVDYKDPMLFSRQYALTNAVKCRQATETMTTNCPAAMINNCAGHLKEEIEILRPSLIITQGAHPSRTVKRLSPFASEKPLETFRGDGGRAEVSRGQDRVILLTTPHPARLKGFNWKEGELPSFLKESLGRVRGELATTG